MGGDRVHKSGGAKLRQLAADLRAMSEDPSKGPFYQYQCKLFERTCCVYLNGDHTDAQMEAHFKHTRSNLGTLNMVVNRDLGIYPADGEIEMVEDEQYRIPSGEGQIEWLAIA